MHACVRSPTALSIPAAVKQSNPDDMGSVVLVHFTSICKFLFCRETSCHLLCFPFQLNSSENCLIWPFSVHQQRGLAIVAVHVQMYMYRCTVKQRKQVFTLTSNRISSDDQKKSLVFLLDGWSEARIKAEQKAHFITKNQRFLFRATHICQARRHLVAVVPRLSVPILKFDHLHKTKNRIISFHCLQVITLPGPVNTSGSKTLMLPYITQLDTTVPWGEALQ